MLDILRTGTLANPDLDRRSEVVSRVSPNNLACTDKCVAVLQAHGVPEDKYKYDGSDIRGTAFLSSSFEISALDILSVDDEL